MVMIIISCGSDPTSPETGVMNVSGAWQGTWESTSFQTSGSFSALFSQNGSELTGFIEIPYIGFDNVPITGTVSSNSVAFGDVGDEIQFTGTISSDTASASGSYTNPGLSDEGTWTMERLSGSIITLVDSIQVPSMVFGSDITWAASKFWILASPYIYSVDPSTGALDSIVAPGSYLWGITYDGTSLIVSEDNWGAGRIFKLDPVTNSILMSPDESATGGLAYDGSSFWCLDGYALRIYRMNGEGTILGSFSCLGDFASGLAFDGTDLWYSSFSGSSSRTIYQVDTDGNLISSFEAPSFMSGGLTFDGQSLWYSDNSGDVVYELDMDGTVLSSFDSPDDGNDLAWDGTHLWLACGFLSSSCQIYCMDRSGSVVASIECPGEQPGGLTYDGTYLWNADVKKGLIFRLDTEGGNINQLPPFEFDYLAFEGKMYLRL